MPDDPRPSLGVVAVGGFGVLAVLVFVAALAFGGDARVAPGDRVQVVSGDGPAGLVVLAGRCLDQRVTAVTLYGEDGSPVWRIVSTKGSIERRYAAGGEPPLGFRTEVGLARPPAGRVRAEVAFEEGDEITTDERSVEVATVGTQTEDLGTSAPPCDGDGGIGATTLLFAAGAALVVAGYVGMLLRFRRRT